MVSTITFWPLERLRCGPGARQYCWLHAHDLNRSEQSVNMSNDVGEVKRDVARSDRRSRLVSGCSMFRWESEYIATHCPFSQRIALTER